MKKTLNQTGLALGYEVANPTVLFLPLLRLYSRPMNPGKGPGVILVSPQESLLSD
jgi:hypothetical protein